MDLLEKNPHKINWDLLCANPNPRALELLRQNQQKICWQNICKNTGIFKLDYDFFKKRMDIFREEMMAYIFHPKRLSNLYYKYYNDDSDMDISDFMLEYGQSCSF